MAPFKLILVFAPNAATPAAPFLIFIFEFCNFISVPFSPYTANPFPSESPSSTYISTPLAAWLPSTNPPEL